jgi:DAK2 domain fusion protein YloV
MIDVLDARVARRWAVSALSALGHAREEIDALNVYPVPDGDTGTNLYLTLEAACASVLALPAGAAPRATTEAFSRGALLGARGNSGIIAAQFLRGWADELAEIEVLDAAGVKRAVTRADLRAWEAVAQPVEGTILSVSRAAAQAAAAAGDVLVEVVSAAAAAARVALARTPQQLEVLLRAGVVDAGGRGLVVLLDTLEDLVLRRSPPRRSRGHRQGALPVVLRPQLGAPAAGFSSAGAAGCPLRPEPLGPGYEVMYLLDAPAGRLPGLRDRLAVLGDSLAVVGGDDLWHVHVHVDDPGAAVEAGIEAGRPHQVRITHFGDQLGGRGVRPSRVPVGLVACAAGPGLERLFAQAGAVVVRTGAGRRPSTGELLDAVRRANAEAVVVLPNDSDTLSVARAAAEAARQAGQRVSVLPTRAQVHGLAAAAVHDPARRVDDDVVRMSAAAGAARDGAVTIAVREAITTAGVCRPGDVLGVVQGDFSVIGDDLAEVAGQVLTRLLSGGGELVTLVVGEGADPGLVTSVVATLRRTRRDLEVSVLDGGQPRYPLLLGVE